MNILIQIFTPEFGFMLLRIATPILLASLGALIADRAGVTNIGLEGTMLFSALSGVLVSAYAKSALIGLLGAILTGVIVSLILAYFALNLKTNIILGGIAINLMASGGTVFLLYTFTNDKGMSANVISYSMPNINIPLIESIPVIGKIVSGHNLLTYLALLSVVIVYILLYKTHLGLKIRSVGENPNAAESVGISVIKIQYVSLAICGILCGLGGAFLSMGYMPMFTREMTAGRGFIALAAQAMGRGTPGGTLLAALIFSFFDAISNTLQLLRIPAEFTSMTPYITTIIILVFYAIRQDRKKNKRRKLIK